MAIMVRDLPADERPREKLMLAGPSCLSNVELLAVLLRTGTKENSVLRVAEQILSRYKDIGLTAMMSMSVRELSDVRGVGTAKAATILAAVELGRRLSQKAAEKVDIIHGPEDAAHYAMPRFRFEQKEHFAIMLLNTKNHILGLTDISVGSLTASIVHPREVFQTALRYAAAAIILFHNHPSGDPSPSKEDIQVTHRLVKAGQIMDIPVLDHIILGNNRFVSLKERGNLS